MAELAEQPNITEIKDSELFTQADLPLESFPLMEQIRSDGRLCDVELEVGDVTINAHRIVLASTIPYFHAMFTTDMREASQKKVTLKGIDGNAFELLVQFAYSGKILINIHNVESIMECASFLQVNKVKEACSNFLINRLTPDNVLGIRRFSESLNCGLVIEEADRFLQKNFTCVAHSEEFHQLDFSDLENILQRDNLYVDSEETVYLIIMEWVAKDEENRSMYIPDLLKCVRLTLLSPYFISDVISTNPFIKNCIECRDLLDQARDYFLIPERRSLVKTFKTQPRRCDDILGFIYVVGGVNKTANNSDSTSLVEYFDPFTKKWKMAEAMKIMRSRVGVASFKNCLYALGGYNSQDNSRLSTVEVYDKKTNSWKKVASMNCRRSAVGASALGDRLYVCGGYDGAVSLNSVEYYDFKKAEWVLTTPMSSHRSACGVVALDQYLYCLGGHNGLEIFNSMERYDPETGQWSYMAPMITYRCRLGATVLGGVIYAIGGYNGTCFLSCCEKYDPKTNTWKSITPMKECRSRVSVVSNGGRIYAIGGYNGNHNLSSIEIYNPETDSWQAGVPMIAHEGGVASGVLTGDIL